MASVMENILNHVYETPRPNLNGYSYTNGQSIFGNEQLKIATEEYEWNRMEKAKTLADDIIYEMGLRKNIHKNTIKNAIIGFVIDHGPYDGYRKFEKWLAGEEV